MSSRATLSSAAVIMGVILVLAGADPSLQSMQSSLQLDTLTVPPSRLVPGCALSPAPFLRLDGNRMVGGLWADLPIATNPWSGDDRSIGGKIRERVARAPMLPDGPPLSRTEHARFQFELADDVERAYAAFYADEGWPPIAVYAVTFKVTTIPQAPLNPSPNGDLRLGRDRTAVLLSGRPGPCSRAVGAYLAELLSP
jgi:hypothetical protein